MKTVAIIQARMSSTRLPGKVLLPLGGTTVLGQVVQRAKACRQLDQVIVATTTEPEDDAIVCECERLQTDSFRGSLSDVLSRFHATAQAYGAEVVVRITSDCPLLDNILLDSMLEKFHAAGQNAPGVDYLSNTLRRTYPRGLDAEIFTFAALGQAHEQAAAGFEREHVTPYIYRHPELFHLVSYEEGGDNADHRWTLDTPEDYGLLQAIYREFDGAKEAFSTGAVLDFLMKNPEVARLNAHVEQKKT